MTNSDVQHQAVMLDKFIHVAARCKALCNFFSMFTILGALDTPRTRRLTEVGASFSKRQCGTSDLSSFYPTPLPRQAWRLLPSDSQRLLAKLQAVFSTDKNMCAYRRMYRQCRTHAPRLPFLPIIMKV